MPFCNEEGAAHRSENPSFLHLGDHVPVQAFRGQGAFYAMGYFPPRPGQEPVVVKYRD